MRVIQPEEMTCYMDATTVESVSLVAYAWAGTYSAGSDCMIYRRYKDALPEYAKAYYCNPPKHVVEFCERENVDCCADDELVGGARKVRLGTDEAP